MIVFHNIGEGADCCAATGTPIIYNNPYNILQSLSFYFDLPNIVCFLCFFKVLQ